MHYAELNEGRHEAIARRPENTCRVYVERPPPIGTLSIAEDFIIAS